MCDIWHVPENVSSVVITASSWYSSFFSSSSNRRRCFISLLFWKFCDNSWIHKSDICSHNRSTLCLWFTENCWWRDYLFPYDRVTPSSGIFCLNIYNQIAVEKKTQAGTWERTKFKPQIWHLLDACPWNKLYNLYIQIKTSTW